MTRPQLKLVGTTVDPLTGEVADGCASCRGLDHDLRNAELELRRLRAQVKSLQRDRDEERQTHPKRAQVLEVFEHWVDSAGKKRSRLSADRFDAVKARLNEGYTVEEIKLAIDGAAAYPFVVNAERRAEGKGEKHDDLELVCRGGRRLEKLANLGANWRKARA